ncbi:MAG TPA: TonB C-terminal domain-containing protein [Blastocatellia bacterium]|nr:TonB C-terminal domain-containing protein [Blastocatellia bacterium]
MFSPVRHTPLVVRLAREALDASRELARRPASFLRNLTLPDPVRGRSRYLGRLLAASLALHLALISYMAYRGLLAPFMGVSIVDEPYRPFDITILKLPYPAQRSRPAVDPRRVMTLEEIREQERKRREKAERERLAREKAERERREREERERAEREKAEAEKLAAEKNQEQPKPAAKTFGEINEAPIRDILGKVYALHKEGALGQEPLKFSVMATFRIKPDGSLSDIKLIKSSGNRVIDENALKILWNIGESHALGPLSDLTSNSIRLDLDDKIARLTITGFAQTPEDAKAKASQLNLLFAFMRTARKGSDTAELLSMIKVRSDSKRLDADLTVSRARAAEMMRARFGDSTPQ